MKHKLLDSVVLNRDIPEHGLQRGDVGAIVEIYEPDGVEVEFVTGDGHTQALLTLHDRDVRSVDADELMSVRRLRRSA
ncbi:MAG: DUF4926 domain-containing protein [Phycisphaerae bacterium]|nr:DUF4926 domain-containing protein [Phycisphaerae bacterium]